MCRAAGRVRVYNLADVKRVSQDAQQLARMQSELTDRLQQAHTG